MIKKIIICFKNGAMVKGLNLLRKILNPEF
jgi:hypothetical protein